MQQAFWNAWQAGAPAVNGGQLPTVLWQGVDDSATPPPATQPYARVTIRHLDGAQTTMGEVGNRRFSKFGNIFVQVFTPLSLKTGLTLLENLATIALGAFEGKVTPSGVWFRNAVIRESEPYQGWNQATVVANFLYDELK